jgi:hypothetical protein
MGGKTIARAKDLDGLRKVVADMEAQNLKVSALPYQDSLGWWCVEMYRVMDNAYAHEVLARNGIDGAAYPLKFKDNSYFDIEVKNNVEWLIERYNLTDDRIAEALKLWAENPRAIKPAAH